MWKLDHKEGWALKNWCLQAVVLEKTLESPLDSREIKPFKPKGNPSWIFIGRTEAETPLDVKSWLTGKDPDAGKDWGQKKGATKDEMVGWCHWLNEHEFVQTPGDREGQGSLACCVVHGVTKSPTWLSDWTIAGDLKITTNQFNMIKIYTIFTQQ